MSASARSWLPRAALCDGVLSVGLTACAERWAADWFGAERPVLARIEGLGPQSAPDGAASWRSEAPGLHATLPPVMDHALARWTLGLSNAPQKLNAADTRLLSALSHACVEDILRRACVFFQIEPRIARADDTRAHDDDLHFSVSVGPARVLDLNVANHAAAAARRAMIEAAPRTVKLAALTEALGATTARVGVMLGAARIGLPDFSSLARGDVLVLDRGRGDSLPLTIDGQVKTSAGGDLQQDGARFRLRLTKLEQGGVQ